MGCMGMSRDDFCRCTPSEFYAAYGAWGDMRQQRERAEWERARLQCLCALQPYSKKQLSARDVMKFPWDEESEEGRVKSEEGRGKSEETSFAGRRERQSITREEMMERYRAARERAGLK